MAMHRQRAIMRYSRVSVLLVCGASACGGESGTRPNEADDQRSALYAQSGVQYWDQTNYVVNVCWNTSGYQAQKNRVRDAITRQWQDHSHLQFTGWDSACPSTIPGTTVPIRLVVSSGPNHWGGFTAPPFALGTTGTVSYLSGSPTATIELVMHDPSLEAVAVHEFGHMLGFIHEHQRPDRSVPANCVLDWNDANNVIDSNGVYYTLYDPDSAMNYCRDGDHNGILDINEYPKWVENLSEIDIAGLQTLYFAPSGRFGSNYKISNWFCLAGEDCFVADVNNDQQADLISFTKTGPVWVAYATASGLFNGNYQRHSYFCVGNETCRVADVGNDGRADLISFTRTGPTYVAHATAGGTFGAATLVSNWFCLAGDDCHAADVDGDGRSDLISFTKTGPVWVAYATPSGLFNGNWQRHSNFCVNSQECKVADLNNDGRADLVAFSKTGPVYAAYAQANGMFGAATQIQNYFCVGSQVCDVADVNGDGRADLVSFTKGTVNWQQDDVWVSVANGGGGWLAAEKWTDYFCPGSEKCAVGKLNADGNADLVSFKGNGEVWAVRAISF